MITNQTSNRTHALAAATNPIAIRRQWRALTIIPLLCGSILLCSASLAADGGLGNGNTAEGDNALNSLTSGAANTAIGDSALLSDTTGSANTASGFQALERNTTGINNTATGTQALFVNNGSNNTADGFNTLLRNTGGVQNTAVGSEALFNNSTGNANTAVGYIALQNNTTGKQNTATGDDALHRNTTGSANTATGFAALQDNSTGNANTATGFEALFSNSASGNTANGSQALMHNTNGSSNTANGDQALSSNTTGFGNTAVGVQALAGNTTSENNTATGLGALFNNDANNNTANGVGALGQNTSGHDNTAIGLGALSDNTSGANNIALGSGAGNLIKGSNNIDIYDAGLATDSNTIRIGTVGTQARTFIAGVHGVAVPNGLAVVVDGTGHLGTVASSERFKEAIQPMDKASEAVLALKPVTFRYKEELDPDHVPQFGLIAEQVEKVNPDLVVRDDEGKIMTVRYDAVNAMLLNEFLKEHRKVQTLEERLAQQQRQIEALTTIVQKVSDHLELNKPAPHVVAND
jgi:hypothetical protein